MPGFVRYIAPMFEVLVFVYENYYAGENYPEPALLERKLNAVGFEADEILDAIAWLQGLNTAARGSQGFAGPIYTTPATADLLSVLLRDDFQRQVARECGDRRGPAGEHQQPQQ